jgi:hypothetical protein
MGLKHKLTKLCNGTPLKILMKIPSFTAVEFSLCNIPQLTNSIEGISTGDIDKNTYLMS